MKRLITVLCSIALPLSCGSGDDGEGIPGSCAGTGDASHVELAATDTIGVELGHPDLVFGVIAGAEKNPRGEVLILDSSTMSIRKFTGDGTLIASAGRQGTGPGEFQMPRGMTVMPGGEVLVADMGGGAISVFDDTLGWTGNITGFFPRPPYVISSAGDSACVGMLPAFDREQGLTGYAIGRLEGTAEPSVVYAREMQPFDPSRFGPMAMEEQPVFTSDASGRVFVAEAGWDGISVTGYLPDGEVFLEIEEEIERVEKTVEELAAERTEFEEMSAGRGRRFHGGDVSFEPLPYRRSVSELGIDGEGRLWVRLGTCRHPFWRVYDMEGLLLFTASFDNGDPDIDQLTVRITENGITAWVPDPTTWPRVLLLEDPAI